LQDLNDSDSKKGKLSNRRFVEGVGGKGKQEGEDAITLKIR